MKKLSTTRQLVAPLLLVALIALVGCSDSTDPSAPQNEEESPEGYPAVPKPQHANDFDQPDESDIFEVIVSLEGKKVDFAPTWTAGTFTWDINIQTHYEELGVLGWETAWDPAATYWDGTRHSSGLRFEGGAVDLRNPFGKLSHLLHTDTPAIKVEMPRRLMLMKQGEIESIPDNPTVATSECFFNYLPIGSILAFSPGIWIGFQTVDTEAGFGQRNKHSHYYVGITSAPALVNPVFMKRERFWRRVLVDETKSVRADPGFSKTVSYTRTTGTSLANSETFAETLEVGASLSPFDVGASMTNTIEETYQESREFTEQESQEVSHTLTGIEGKTVIFSVWQSVERYSFVNEAGEPYTDPSYTFGDLGNTMVQGDHEILQSAIFDYQAQ